MDEDQNLLADSLITGNDHSLPEELRHLVTEARELAQAEVAYHKSRASYAGGKAAWILALGLAAAVFLFFALMALVLGAILALAPLLTPLGATAAVTAALLVISLLCVFGLLTLFRRMKSVLSDDSAD